MKLKIQVGGMHCSHCTQAVETALRQLAEVRKCSVDLGEAVVIFDESLTTRGRLFAAIGEAGDYHITGFSVCR